MTGRLLEAKDITLLHKKTLEENNFGVNEGINLEWWYLSGVFWERNQGQSKQKNNKEPVLGMHVAFFFSTLKGGYNSLLGHAATTCIEDNSYKVATSLNRFLSRYLSEILSDKKINIMLNTWVLEQITAKKWRLQCQIENLEYSLMLSNFSHLWLHGNNGALIREDNFFEYYYSIPFIDAIGTVIDKRGDKVKEIEGKLWFDHQIGIANIDKLEWIWFGLQFEDNSACMILVSWGNKGEMQVLAEFYSQENTRKKRPFLLSDVHMKKLRKYTLKSGSEYILDYIIDYYNEASNMDGSLTINPVVVEQEFYSIKEGTRYWEGMVRVVKKEGDRKINGYGYLEIKKPRF